MTIYKDIEISSSDFSTADLLNELEERIDSHHILFTKEYQDKLRPQVNLMLERLEEISNFLNSRT